MRRWLPLGGGAYRDLTPHTVEPSQALVTLNGFVTLVTLGGAVPFHPEMMHYLQRGGETAYWEEKQREKNRGAEKQDVHKSTSDTTIKAEREERERPDARTVLAPSANRPCPANQQRLEAT